MERTPELWEARGYEILGPKNKKGERIIIAEALSSGDRGHTNAKLLAAGPRMLKSLKDALDMLSPEEWAADWAVTARAAIKAATKGG